MLVALFLFPRRSEGIMTIDWNAAWQITGVAFGFTFVILFFLAFIVWLSRFIVSRIPGGEETHVRPDSNPAGRE